MSQLVASLPPLVQLGLIPVVGVVVAGIYALVNRQGIRSRGAALSLLGGVVGAIGGGFLLHNYLAAALVALFATWLVNRVARGDDPDSQ